jgi:soluble lytic murein transglycosylase-like protein
MNKTDKEVNAIFIGTVMVLVIVMIVLISTNRGTAEANYEATTEPTTIGETEDATEEVTEPTENETIATEPPAPLYDVPLNEDLQIHIIETANAHDIDPAIIFAMAWKESTYRTDAIGDSGNSIGLLQIQPRWHSGRMEKLNCTNLLNPYQNVVVACDYLSELIDRYGSMDKALTAYNRGHYAGVVTDYATTVMAKANELVVK